MSNNMLSNFTRTHAAVAVSAALYVLAGAAFAAYEARTPVSGQNDEATSNGTDPVTISILDNDGNVDGSTLAISSQPSSGTVEIVGSAIVYTPGASFSGSDSFTYSVTETDWRPANTETYSLLGIDAATPIATSYARIPDSVAVPIFNGGSTDVNSVDLSAEATGSWNDTNVASGGVVGRSWMLNQTTTQIDGCNAGDTASGILSLQMIWTGSRTSSDSNPGGNQFTITNAAAPSPDVEVSNIATSGIALKVHSSVDAVPAGEPDNIAQNGSSVLTTGGQSNFQGGDNWDFTATANWVDVTPADFESMNITVLASLFNNKHWFNRGATFEATTDLSTCTLNTSTMTVTVTDDSSDGGDDGDSGSSGGSSSSGAFGGAGLLMLALFGMRSIRRRTL